MAKHTKHNTIIVDGNDLKEKCVRAVSELMHSALEETIVHTYGCYIFGSERINIIVSNGFNNIEVLRWIENNKTGIGESYLIL